MKLETKLDYWQILLFKDLPGLQDLTRHPDLPDVEEYFLNKGLAGGDASFIATYYVKGAKAVQFKKEHPKPPRHWRRSKLGGRL